MGQDYRLKKLYEQIYSDKKEQTSSTPKNLQEAYKHVLVERTAFYAKDIAAGEEIPKIQGLEVLGDVENPEKIKHAIVSYSLLTPLEQLFQKADEAGKGWHKPPVVGVNLNSVAQEFVALNISGEAVSTILRYKEQLKALEEKIKSSSEFNMKNVVLSDLKKIQVSAKDEDLTKLYNFLFKMTASIALASVGAGEIVATLLTNAKKGTTGDLVFGKDKVEIKGLGGRLGKAGYAWKNTAKGLANFLTNIKRTSKVGKETSTSLSYKDSIRTAVNKIQNNESVAKYIDPKYFELISSFLYERNLKNLEKLINRSEILTLPSKQFMGKFIKDTDPKLSLTPTPPPESAIKIFKDQNNNIKFYLKKLLSYAEEHQKEEDVLDPKSLANQNFNTAVARFFLNEIGLTAQQAAEAFIKHAKTEDIEDDKMMATYGPAITSFFTSHYDSMKRGNSRPLEALIFGYSLAIYARKGGEANHFDYFLMVNDATQDAIAVNTSLPAGDIVLECANKFMSNSKFSLSVRADERGGSAISYGKFSKSKAVED